MYRKRYPILFAAGLLAASLCFNSCSDDDENDDNGGNNNSNCDTTAISYASDIRPIVISSCATGSSCHGSGSGNGDFSSYAGLKIDADNGKLRQRVLIEKDMPPGGWSSCNRLKLEAWLNAGAPNN